MKISARNLLAGTVAKVTKGAVNTEVDLTLKGGEKVASVITNGSAEALGLKEGKAAYAILKASAVMIAKDVDPKKISARNVLPGKVAKVTAGAVNAEVDVTLAGGTTVVSIITLESCKGLGLKAGDAVSAIVKASSVMVGVD